MNVLSGQYMCPHCLESIFYYLPDNVDDYEEEDLERGRLAWIAHKPEECVVTRRMRFGGSA